MSSFTKLLETVSNACMSLALRDENKSNENLKQFLFDFWCQSGPYLLWTVWCV